MVNYVGAEKPDLLELAHYGKKGMKWGVHKQQISGDTIRDARVSVYNQGRDIRKAKKMVRKTTAKGSAERAAGEKKVGKMETAFLKNPDRITASRMTRGEQAIAVILFTPGGAAGAIGGRALVTHLIKKEVEKAGGKSEGH